MMTDVWTGAGTRGVDDVVGPFPLEDHHTFHEVVREKHTDLNFRAVHEVR